ncbi:MAG TPA: phosphatase PAP2 family protein [Planctomycetota bacterium]|nr:phosphatase PAP2 family protein [Planctomycetota bacterium]
MKPEGLSLRTKEWILPFVCLCAVVLLTELTPIDFALSDLFFDAKTGSFPLKSVWYMKFLHTGGRAIVFLTALASLLIALAAIRAVRLRPYWRASLFVLVCIGGAGALVGFLKHQSQRPCPYKTDRYGGSTPHLGLFENLPHGVEYGNCFPAAHAAGAFGLFAFYFVFRDRDPVRARRALWLAILAGNLYGFIQIVRGQHYLSHHLWSGVIVWYLCLAIYTLAFRGRLWPSAAASA